MRGPRLVRPSHPRPAAAAGPATGGSLARSRRAGGPAPERAGRGLPGPLRDRMERAFGADLSQVRVHQDARADAVGALAYAQGADLHFGPGEYRPDTAYGQALIGHELAHVVQQRSGRVAGRGVDPDPGLEREAHRAGLRAARGEPAHLPGAGAVGPRAEAKDGAAAPIQRTPKWLKKALRGVGLMRPHDPRADAPPPPVWVPAANPVDDFVAAYDNARYYHGTEAAGDARSIHDHGLLVKRDRMPVLGREPVGMSTKFRDSPYAGDEAKGVFMGPREFVEREQATIPAHRVRTFLPHSKTRNVLGPGQLAQAGADDLVLDDKFPGARISTTSIPPSNTFFGDMSALAAAPDARLGTILQTVATHYPQGHAPSPQEMIDLLQQAIAARRLSTTAFTLHGDPVAGRAVRGPRPEELRRRPGGGG